MRTLRQRVILDLDREDIPTLLAGSSNIQTKMTQASAVFVAPTPTMAVLSNHIGGLASAQLVVTGTRAKGAVEARNVARDLLWSSLESERSYVQSFCDQAPPGEAANYAASAGMRIASTPRPSKPLLQASLTTSPGVASVVANAQLLVPPAQKKYTRRTYLWRASIDGGHTFIMGDPTPVAHTLFSGFPVNSMVTFQVAVKDSTGTSEWSQPVLLFIH